MLNDIEAPLELKVDFETNPLGSDNLKPKLSWILRHKERARKQMAYHVLMTSSM